MDEQPAHATVLADRMTAGGLTLAVASIDALIRMKTGTGRAQDASDVDALRRVQRGSRGP